MSATFKIYYCFASVIQVSSSVMNALKIGAQTEDTEPGYFFMLRL